MSFPRLRRRRATTTAEGLLESVRQRQAAAGELTDTEHGHLVGLSDPSSRRARLAPEPGESVVHHGSYLLGKLVTFTETRGITVDPDFLVPAMTVYTLAVADHAARPDKDIRDPRVPVHTYAMVWVERKLGRPLEVEREEHLLTWLLTSLGLRPTDDAARILGKRRARRLAKLFPDRPPETSDRFA